LCRFCNFTNCSFSPRVQLFCKNKLNHETIKLGRGTNFRVYQIRNSNFYNLKTFFWISQLPNRSFNSITITNWNPNPRLINQETRFFYQKFISVKINEKSLIKHFQNNNCKWWEKRLDFWRKVREIYYQLWEFSEKFCEIKILIVE
jgi:hypothetical protein